MRGTALAVTGPQWLELERAMGIEPTAQAWEAWVLPLYDARYPPDSSRDGWGRQIVGFAKAKEPLRLHAFAPAGPSRRCSRAAAMRTRVAGREQRRWRHMCRYSLPNHCSSTT